MFQASGAGGSRRSCRLLLPLPEDFPLELAGFLRFINIGMSIGLMPVTGVPLPFVSYGGSFVLMGLTGCGILQSVYRYRDTGN